MVSLMLMAKAITIRITDETQLRYQCLLYCRVMVEGTMYLGAAASFVSTTETWPLRGFCYIGYRYDSYHQCHDLSRIHSRLSIYFTS